MLEVVKVRVLELTTGGRGAFRIPNPAAGTRSLSKRTGLLPRGVR